MMVEECLQDWANGVRFQLINDPARKQYNQRIQEYGLDFLDAYLDDVLQQDNALDIFKTPGRKRASPKKQRAPHPRQLHAISEQENTDDDIFNDPLPHIRQASEKCNDEDSNQVSTPPIQNTLLREVATLKATSPPSIIVTPDVTHSNATASQTVTPAIIPVQEQKDLSIIAEDEEIMERSPSVVPIPTLPAISEKETPTAKPAEELQKSMSDTTNARAVSPRHSPSPQPVPSEDPAKEYEYQSSEPEAVHAQNNTEDKPETQPDELQPGLDSETEPHASSYPDDTETFWAPLKDEEDSTQRKATAAYQSLPAPPPFRKSTRLARDPSMPVAPGMFAPVTPAPVTVPGAGKRTSWLSRVREARAIENAQKPNLPPSSTSHTMTRLGSKPKRKSGEGDGGANIDEEQSGRKYKLQKMDSEIQQSSDPQEMEASGSQKDVGMAEMSSSADLGLTALKKRIEDIGNQRNKVAGKPLDGVAAANILAKTAEARAAVLASLADNSGETLSLTNLNENRHSNQDSLDGSRHARFSISELSTGPSRSLLPPPKSEIHSRVSTTPPHPPPQDPSEFVPRPVFSKPPPVFSAPSPNEAPSSPPCPPTRTFSPPSMTLGLGTRFSPVRSPPQSSQRAVGEPSPPPAVFTKAADSTYEAFGHKYQDGTFSKIPAEKAKQVDEDDDSWPVEENPTETGFWTYSNAKDDTWSTSQATTTRKIAQPSENETQPISRGVPGGLEDVDMDEDVDITEAFTGVRDLGDEISRPTVALVKASQHNRTDSQMSMASTESSNSQPVGFLGQATKFMSSMLGTSKKAKPSGPVKSLQLAAAAAKKHQEEEDKKVTRMKEMENRRQLALQRKAEDEKARAIEEEKRIREEGERRKREREEHTDKRPLKPAAKKEETVAKKLKLAAPETEKKEIKRVTSKTTLAAAKSTSSLKAGSSKALALPVPTQASSSTKPLEIKPTKLIPGNSKGKAKAAPMDDDLSQPSQLMQNQMAARAKAQMQAAKSEPVLPSESIELPDINSEYSDSEDEDRKRTYEPPDWAQGDEFVNRLQEQSKLNPDDIFGPVRPLKMEEIFKTRTSKFRARSSSANWSGTDRLTAEEEREYAKRMGYTK